MERKTKLLSVALYKKRNAGKDKQEEILHNSLLKFVQLDTPSSNSSSASAPTLHNVQSVIFAPSENSQTVQVRSEDSSSESERNIEKGMYTSSTV
ncbi:hypothetical protein NPIL_194861 [Nephila pilipes]|uniref:Uncharacterized protein n=1 Tax=Nephila pilipes TaxID=299642 RepID=A0A8X6TZR5_NEPPI|nr:hypothetical protein NPIL_194861 [Nephila pilipes]